MVHIQSVLFTISYYIFLACVYYGWGCAFLSLYRWNKANDADLPQTFRIWIGWAITLGIFQALHFFWPINAYSVGPIFVVGLILSAWYCHRAYQKSVELTIPTIFRFRVVRISATICLIVICSWLASRSMLPAEDYDSGLYHLQTIRWTNEYPIIPGLGNLHGRLAFNQSFFTYVASLNIYPYFSYGRSIANSFLLILTTATMVDLLLPYLSKPIKLLQESPLSWAPALFLIPILHYWYLFTSGTSSPSTDTAVWILQAVIFVMLCRIISFYNMAKRISTLEIATFYLICATAITVKFTNIVFCGVAIIICYFLYIHRAEVRLKGTLLILIPSACLAFIMFGRGYILSGAPVYPSAIGYLDLEWSVPIEKMEGERKMIYSWARQPGYHWKDVLGKWDWFDPWLIRQKERFVDVAYPFKAFLALLILATILTVIYKIRRKEIPKTEWLLLAPICAGLIFWFFTAPDQRFAFALLLLSPIAVSVVVMSLFQKQPNRWVYVLTSFCLYLIATYSVRDWVDRSDWALEQISAIGWIPGNTAPMKTVKTNSGFSYSVPIHGNQAWDAPLPNAPHKLNNLRLRTPGKIEDGFTVKPVSPSESTDNP